MDFLTKIAINVMPIVQDPSFKKGCYGLALITVIVLILIITRTVIRRKREKDGTVISDRSNPGITFISMLFFISLSVGILADITEWNEPGKITVLDNGEVISRPKSYLSVGKKKTAVYDQTKMVASADKNEIAEPVTMKFEDSGIAEVDYKFDLKLPKDPKEIMAIHKKFGSQDKLVDQGAKPVINEAIKIGAMLLSSEECSEEKEKKLAQFVNDQLKDGLYLLVKGIPIKDKDGKYIRKKHYLSGLKVKFEKFKLENFKKEELVRNIELEKERIVKELKKIDLIGPENTPFINDLEKMLRSRIIDEKKLSKDQKELLITSLQSAKKLIFKLQERKPGTTEKKKDLDI